jgi:peptidoglycan/LPS O-acetylase OafA/YrhL
MGKLQTIQVLRAIACIYVMLSHLFLYFKSLFPGTVLASLFVNGYSGVDIFFVISGFVIYISTKGTKPGVIAFISYLKKRFVRIFPIYWIAFILFLFINTSLDDLSITNLISAFFLLPYHTPVFDISWTLSFEIYFYIVFGIAILRSDFIVLPIAIFLLATIYFILSTVGSNTSLLPLHQLAGSRVLEFFLGVIAGIFYKKIPISFAYIFVVSGLFFFFSRNIFSNTIYNFGIPSMLIVMGATKIETVKKISFPKIILLIGNASYVIYLIHNPFLRDTILSKLAKLSLLTKFNFCLLNILTVAVGIIIHQYIEAPLIKYLNRKMSLKHLKSAPCSNEFQV